MSNIVKGIGEAASSYVRCEVVKNHEEDVRIINTCTVFYNLATVTMIALTALAVSYASIVCLFVAGIVFVARMHLDELIQNRMGKITTALGVIGQQNANIGGDAYCFVFRRTVNLY